MPGTTEPKRIGLIKKKTIRLVLKLYQDLLELVLTYYLRFGRKVVRIEVGSHTMVCHTIPENLLCQSSALFRDELQPKRKDVSGDCSIWNEVLQHREVEKPDREQDAISSLPIRMGGREKHNRCSLIPLSEQEVFRSLCALAIPQGGLHLCRRGRKRNTSVVIRSRHVAERSPILQGSTRRHSRDHTRTR
jgi:hypothetical protein